MLLALFLCALGLTTLVVGGELIVRGGGALALRLRVPPIVIGLTVVAVGTSTPELAVGIDAAVRGEGGLAVGNIAGTNTVNILLILGLSAVMAPLTLAMRTLRLELPVMIATALALGAMAWDGRLTRLEGALMLIAGVVYTVVLVMLARRESQAVLAEAAEDYGPRPGRNGDLAATAKGLGALLGGIVVIVMGADWLVDGAVGLARLWGVSDVVIGLTIVAIGTSAPELVTTVVSTLRQSRDIAVGNLIGSSVYNILFILGATCLIVDGGLPVSPELVRVDIPVMAAAVLVCVPVFITGRRVSRLEGGLFVAAYLVYLAYLLIERT